MKALGFAPCRTGILVAWGCLVAILVGCGIDGNQSENATGGGRDSLSHVAADTSGPAKEGEDSKSMDLALAATKTVVAWSESTLRQSTPLPGERHRRIPPQFWEEPIRRLAPLYVYEHRLNLAVVRGLTNAVESGLYVQAMHSSHFAMAGEDGFEFPDDTARGGSEPTPVGARAFLRRIEPTR